MLYRNDLTCMLFVFLPLLYSQEMQAQKRLVIKPGLVISYGFNHISENLTAEKSFVSPKPGFIIALDGRIEFYLDEQSFLDLEIKGTEAAFSFGFSNEVFKYIHQTGVPSTQYQISFNRFIHPEKQIFKNIALEIVSIRPKVSLGAGIATNQKAWYYKEYFYQQYYGGQSTPASYWRRYTAIGDKDLGLHMAGRIGFSLFRKKRELFDLMLGYNKGLRNLSKLYLQYNIDGTTYETVLGSRGTNFNLTAGVPITLFHFR